MKIYLRILNTGTEGLSASAADCTRMTNLVSSTTVLLTLAYLSYYWFALDSFFMLVVNGLFAIGYAIPLFLNKVGQHISAKVLFFVVLIIHITLLSIYTFTLAAGFHLYLILVIPGVLLVFEYSDTLYKTALSVAAIIAIFICEFVDNQAPLIPLTADESRVLFRSAVLIIMAELLLVNYFYTRDIHKREMLYQQLADTDPLTGLFNRRCFNKIHNQHLQFAMRYKRPFALLLLDLDFFKKINDEYGHSAGDEVLTQIADILTQESRYNDLVARIGGEEFAVILPETDKKNAFKVAENLRQKIDAHCFDIKEDKSIKITVSIGVQAWNNSIKLTSQLLEQADKALYEAKDSGRNVVVCYESDGK